MGEENFWPDGHCTVLPTKVKFIKNLALANMTVSDDVCPSTKGGPELAQPPSKSATVKY